ncbi:MAG: co-chaperone GroES [Puniceicoccales bacterium]|jgi:chaperonin GroES|nr:co-chaperone GroES [Puniceicoccales bacterium]
MSKKMKLVKPLGDRVLVRRRKDAEQIKGGIVIPDTAKEQSQEAEVIALGSGKIYDCKDGCASGKQIEFEVRVGDLVLISRYGGNEFKVDGEEYVILRQSDILGVLAGESESCCCGCCGD